VAAQARPDSEMARRGMPRALRILSSWLPLLAWALALCASWPGADAAAGPGGAGGTGGAAAQRDPRGESDAA
jgi:hypothetical protein